MLGISDDVKNEANQNSKITEPLIGTIKHNMFFSF